MSINPSQPETPSVLRRYVVAGLCALASLLLRGMLDPVLGSLLPLSTTFGFVALAAWYGGWGPALFAAIVSYLGASWLFIEPRFAFELGPAPVWRFAAYMSSITVMIVIGEAMRRAQQRAIMSAATALGQQRMAEGETAERKRAEAALRESQDQLRYFSGQLEKLVQDRTEELMQSQNRLRVLATELNLAEQRERKRLATELHDYLAQLLVVCRINLGHTKRIGLPTKANEILEETEGVLNKALNYCRTLMAELSPPVLQDHGLPAGLQWLGQQMQRHGLVVTVDLGEMSDRALPDDCTMLLFQSVRELLMNTLKHAATDKVGIRLAQKDGTLRIEVRDEGVGFDLAAALTATTATDISSKFGLFSINERMKALGGWFDVYSVPGKGTTATLILPIEGMDAVALNGERHASSAHAELLTHTPTAVSAPGHVLTADASPEDLSGPKQPVIRLLLVDDHAMVRQGLRSVLESYPDIMVVGEASNGEEAVASAGLL